MTRPIVYGTIVSPPVRSVLLTASAIGLDIEFKDINLSKKEQLAEAYLKKNPQHTVPTLDDNGHVIWDSHAIATYLIGKYATDDSLYPKDLHTRGRIDQRLHFDSGILFSTLRDIVFLIRRTQAGLDDRTKAKTFEGYDFLELFLTKDFFLVGDSLTVADLCCVSTVTTLDIFVPIDAAKYPKLTQWIERISKQTYYATANQSGIDLFKRLVTPAPTSVNK